MNAEMEISKNQWRSTGGKKISNYEFQNSSTDLYGDFLLIYSHFLTQDVNFESPQFKPIDHLKGVNGELILETNAIDYGDKISFYVEKSKLRMKSTFPKIMILSSFYEYDIPTHDHVPKNKESKVSIAVSEVHYKNVFNLHNYILLF